MSGLSLISLFLLAFLPFLKFLRFHEYPLASPEIIFWLGLLLLMASFFSFFKNRFLYAAAVSFFLFILLTGGPQTIPPIGLFVRGGIALGVLFLLGVMGEKAPRIVFLFALGMGVSDLALNLFSPKQEISREALQAGVKGKEHLLYLILDEQIGIDGFPDLPGMPEFRKKLIDFYTGNGFLLFPKAYSNYFYTGNSISNTLNGTFESVDGAYVTDNEPKLVKNRLFDDFRSQGYRINAYSFGHVDFCAFPVSKCYVYAKNSPTSLVGEDYSVADRMRMTAMLYLATNSVFKEIRKRVPDGGFFISRAGPLKTVPKLFAEVERDILKAEEKTLFFVHVMMPHHPYMYDSACRPKPVSDWLIRIENYHAATPKNSPEGYKKRYQAYAEQDECLHRMLGNLFDRLKKEGLYDGMNIVVHGDHGSRITLNYDAYADFADSIGKVDMIASHSTLLALKFPGDQEGRIDPRQGSLTSILNALLYEKKPFEGEKEHFVLLKQKKGKKELIRRPMPLF
ncbi:MAG: sulfatase-like hydrolase/transferase [Deltaproteobacteria bacterium]|nr:sulfatase-like hydrolase/transferase [Deltaproteobacteria bacterium]